MFWIFYAIANTGFITAFVFHTSADISHEIQPLDISALLIYANISC